VITTRSFPVTTRGRYLARAARSRPRAVLVGFHGYAENAERHLERLQTIPGADDLLLCSVQGLHWFYNLKTEEVVANWMTRLDREAAIADNIDYVNRALDDLASGNGSLSTLPLIFLGFSQGAAMAYRAAAHGRFRPAGVIVLGGELPPEIANDEGISLPPILIGQGERDEWYNNAKCDADVVLLRKRGWDVTLCRFEGGHEWSAAFLVAAGEFLERV